MRAYVYAGLYPFEMRSRRAMLNERAKRERARAEVAQEMARLDELERQRVAYTNSQ